MISKMSTWHIKKIHKIIQCREPQLKSYFSILPINFPVLLLLSKYELPDSESRNGCNTFWISSRATNSGGKRCAFFKRSSTRGMEWDPWRVSLAAAFSSSPRTHSNILSTFRSTERKRATKLRFSKKTHTQHYTNKSLGFLVKLNTHR